MISSIVVQHGFKNPKIFGSVARGDDHDGSDLDLIVERGNGLCTLVTTGRLFSALTDALGVEVDVKTSDLISDRIMQSVLDEAVPLNDQAGDGQLDSC